MTDSELTDLVRCQLASVTNAIASAAAFIDRGVSPEALDVITADVESLSAFLAVFEHEFSIHRGAINHMRTALASMRAAQELS